MQIFPPSLFVISPQLVSYYYICVCGICMLGVSFFLPPHEFLGLEPHLAAVSITGWMTWQALRRVVWLFSPLHGLSLKFILKLLGFFPYLYLPFGLCWFEWFYYLPHPHNSSLSCVARSVFFRPCEHLILESRFYQDGKNLLLTQCWNPVSRFDEEAESQRKITWSKQFVVAKLRPNASYFEFHPLLLGKS